MMSYPRAKRKDMYFKANVEDSSDLKCISLYSKNVFVENMHGLKPIKNN